METIDRFKETLENIMQDLGFSLIYVVRDHAGKLFGFTHKPHKTHMGWVSKEGDCVELDSHKLEFLDITFNDKHPTEVSELLKDTHTEKETQEQTQIQIQIQTNS